MDAKRDHALGLQIVEPVQRVLPGFLGGGFVVTRCGVVVEAVIGLGIDVAFMRNARLGQGRIKAGQPPVMRASIRRTGH